MNSREKNRETTDLTLFVRRSEEDVARWDRERIVEALVRETGIGREMADEISREVEKQIFSSGISLLTSQLIRELVNARLIERGLEDAVRRHARLGFPLYDVENFILHPNRERASVPHGPEGTNMILAEGIKRDYALSHVFSRSVTDAHVMGDLHLHDLGFIDRIVGIHQPLINLKRTGLDFPSTLTVARPAKHPEVLLAHLIRFSTWINAYVSGMVSWEGVNISFAPYVEGMGKREMAQFAQMLVYEFSQLASATGGQAMFTDIHLYWDLPESMADLPMVGPGGKETGKTCRDYLPAARRLMEALIEVYREGDGEGKPFVFPRPIFHLSGKVLKGKDREFILNLCALAVEKGNPCFVFDRKTEKGGKLNLLPRYIIHNCSINLPRLGYRAGGEDEKLLSYLREIVELACQTHSEKNAFLKRLISYGEDGPLTLFTSPTGVGTLGDRGNACFLVGLVGLDELTYLHRGMPLYSDKNSLDFALSLVREIKRQLKVYGEREKMRIILGQLPAEALSHRFARLDLRYFSPLAGRYVRGDIGSGGIYYTDYDMVREEAEIKAFERISKEGEFHRLVEGDATAHIWLGNEPPPAQEVMEFVIFAWDKTKLKGLVFAPDFTLCRSCGAATRGRWEKCSKCGAEEVDNMSIITRYFSRVSRWNKGKQAEFRHRVRYNSLITPQP